MTSAALNRLSEEDLLEQDLRLIPVVDGDLQRWASMDLPCEGGTLEIGRAGRGLLLQDGELSGSPLVHSEHARITCLDGAFYIHILGSQMMTFINEQGSNKGVERGWGEATSQP